MDHLLLYTSRGHTQTGNIYSLFNIPQSYRITITSRNIHIVIYLICAHIYFVYRTENVTER